ncbi:MAG TPA: T9SS type A sorting domain-containing protein, partial [Chitinophagales bacterium]|nr:T9SS type A sorting domain-containing protein [Chitinophagales bacterium]
AEVDRERNEKEANEEFFLVRSYPDPYIDPAAYEAVMKDAILRKNSTREEESWTIEGPGNIGGRINCTAIEPGNPNVMYVGNASGGVFKTTDGGSSWFPVFDAQPYLAIGAITIDPSNHQTVWVGTGDLNISGYPFIGDGIYKSTDGGSNWIHMGLEAQSIVSKIIIDPANSNIIYAATMGIPFFESADRGLYKSTDGGANWSQVLFVDEDAGIIDLVMNPDNAQVLYAASWNRIRNNQVSFVHGPDAHIYKSIDGGSNWTILTNGLPAFNTSRIGLAISLQNPDKLYAMVVDTTYTLQGIYKTTNAGSSWSNATGNFDNDLFGAQGWYFGKIFVNPLNDNEIYVPGVDLQRSTNGGTNWSSATPPWWTYEVHADGHYIDFVNGSTLYYSTDGGMYKTTDNCISWSDAENIPNTQFYRVTYNPHQPDKAYGGAQDNGTTGGNATLLNSWPRIYGGDGFKIIFDPGNSDVFYVETQNGGLSYTNSGGLSYNDFTSGINDDDRRSWDMPYMISPLNPSTFFTGTYRMYKRTGAPGGSWNPVSSDLTDGVIYGDRFHVITTISQSRFNENYLYAGTSDGNVWSTVNGSTWNNVTSTLPDRYVTAVHASPNQLNTVYVTHSGYKYNDFIPHIHKSLNNGETWIDISGDLPQWAVNDVLVVPGNDEKIFVATDGGVYYTENSGSNWNRLGNNMPMIAVYDIELNPVAGKLIAGTFARSIWTIDVSEITAVEMSSANVVKFRLYPNPVSQELHVEVPALKTFEVAIIDSRGNSVSTKSYNAPQGSIELPVHQLKNGIYFLKISTEKEEWVEKIIKAEEE